MRQSSAAVSRSRTVSRSGSSSAAKSGKRDCQETVSMAPRRRSSFSASPSSSPSRSSRKVSGSLIGFALVVQPFPQPAKRTGVEDSHGPFGPTQALGQQGVGQFLHVTAQEDYLHVRRQVRDGEGDAGGL